MSNMFKVFCGNLSFDTTEEQLRKIFEPHFEIEDVVIARDPKTDKPKGYGFVMTKDAEKGRKTLLRVRKSYISGRPVYFKEAHGKKGGPKKPARPERRGRRPGTRSHRPPRRPPLGSGYVGMDEDKKAG